MSKESLFPIPVWIDKSYIQKVLQCKYENPNVTVNKVLVQVATKKGDGMASEIFRVSVESSLGDLSLILKKPHEDKEKLANVLAFDSYNREIGFYLETYPEIKEVLESIQEYEEIVPELFHADYETGVLIISDLREEGFATGDRVNRVSFDHAKIFMRKLAKMHAASMLVNRKTYGALEQKDLKLFKANFNEFIKSYIFAVAKDMRENWGEEFQQLIDKVTKCAENYVPLSLDNVCSRQGLNVMIHGDPWFNNILLKGEPGYSQDVLLIDLQTASWGSLAIDLIYFTITSLSAEDFNGREELFKVYHGHLERVLRKLSWAPIPSFEDILKEYKDHFFHGFYSIVAKIIALAEPTGDDFLTDQGDGLLNKIRNPRIHQELQHHIRLFNEFGTLDTETGTDS